MDVLLFVGLVVIVGAGLALAVLQLPGTWLILLGAAGYDWHYGFERFGWKWLLMLGGIAILAEVFDGLAGALVAKKAGASRQAMIGALLGGFVGMLSLTIPIPIIGTVIGGIIGCFVGAVVGELSVRNDYAASTRVGVSAVIGRVFGLFAKTAAAIVIAGMTVLLAGYAMFDGSIPEAIVH
ncbi:MAG: DUF456 domain-containing protein [Phycisphaerales bacterium]|nr:DUF456 domain-containing protein [Phycisphaerales bacterium]MCB9855439.1 DUF456 domain-containing protein [Phycisphaerales bacterium]